MNLQQAFCFIPDIMQVDGATSDTEVEFASPECTLAWSMSTPAVFPRPNITCGYYSFDHDDVIRHLPAGLTLHKFPNESWQASFQETHIQVIIYAYIIKRSKISGCLRLLTSDFAYLCNAVHVCLILVFYIANTFSFR